MKKERKFDGVWDAEKVLRNYLNFANEDGVLIDMTSYEESPYKIRQRRFLAAMKAYGRDENGFYHSDASFHSDRGTCRYLISKTRSTEKMEEFRSIIKNHLSSNAYYENILTPDSFSNEMDIWLAFEKLFEFRKGLFALEHQWSGVLECSPSLGLIFRATTMLYQSNISVVGDVMDRMLILLMGDDYDKSFTEKQLFEYGYPDVTDEELYEMDMDW